jgi:hypothetical protein
MRDPLAHYEAAFRALGISFESENLASAARMTSFDEVRRMEDRHREWHGHRADPAFRRRYRLNEWRRDPEVRFARSGKIGQWIDELHPTTVDAVIARLAEAGLDHIMPMAMP